MYLFTYLRIRALGWRDRPRRGVLGSGDAGFWSGWIGYGLLPHASQMYVGGTLAVLSSFVMENVACLWM